jgi:hypothetical protein
MSCVCVYVLVDSTDIACNNCVVNINDILCDKHVFLPCLQSDVEVSKQKEKKKQKTKSNKHNVFLTGLVLSFVDSQYFAAGARIDAGRTIQ